MPSTAQPGDRYTHALLTFQSLYDTYLAPSLPAPVAAILNTLIASAIQAQPYISQLTSLFYSLITTLTGTGGSSAESTALVSTAIMVVALYITLRVFNYVRRMVMGWVIFVVKLVVILLGVQVLFYVNKYGWENALRDASWWGGLVWGFVEEVLEGDQGGARQAKGTRSRASVGSRRGGQYGYNGREQAPVGGRTRWT